MTKHEILTKIFDEIDNIPPITDNINKIKELIHDPNSTIVKISKYIKRDPGLTADILRIANSAWYMTRNRVELIENAVNIIGLRELESIIISIGAKKVLKERYSEMEEIWDHSYQCAFYTQCLMKMKGMSDELEVAYVIGLLHDIGKLVLLSLTPKLMERITELSQIKNVSISEIEKLAIGLNHGEIGEKIAKKWNFPEKVSVAIGNHHTPMLAKPEFEATTFTVYLANFLCHNSEFDPSLIYQIDSHVLSFFNITSSNQLEKIINTLTEFYKSEAEVTNKIS